MGFGLGKKLQQSHPDEALGPLKLAVAGGFSGKYFIYLLTPPPELAVAGGFSGKYFIYLITPP